MNDNELKELEELRLFKQQHEGKALNRAFQRLQQMVDTLNYEPIMSVRAFRIVAECLICLKDDLGK